MPSPSQPLLNGKSMHLKEISETVMKGISGKHPHPLVVAVQLIFEYTYQDECKCDGWM